MSPSLLSAPGRSFIKMDTGSSKTGAFPGTLTEILGPGWYPRHATSRADSGDVLVVMLVIGRNEMRPAALMAPDPRAFTAVACFLLDRQ